jgi:hypothetical protein
MRTKCIINMDQEYFVFFSNFADRLKKVFKIQEPIIATIIQKIYSLILTEEVGIDGLSTVKARKNKRGSAHG